MTLRDRLSVAIVLSSLIALFSTWSAALAAENEVRGWRWGSDGKQIFEGRLVSVDKGFAKIKGAKGKDMLIPIDRLFPEDREYVESWVNTPIAPQGKNAEKNPKPEGPPKIPDTDKARIALAQKTREWQKWPLDAKAMAKVLTQLRSPDADQRKQAMTRLAITKPDVRFAADVSRLAKDSRSVVGDEFYRKMQPQVCDSWDGIAQADQISRRAKNLQGLEAIIVNGNSLERSQAICALKYFLSAEAAEILVRRFTISPLDCQRSLEEMGPVAAPAVLTMLSSDDAKLRREALEILKEVGQEDQFADVRKHLTDSDPQVRIAASNAVKAIEARTK